MQQAANDGWGSVLHPDDVEDTMAAWKECARTGNTWYREHRMMGVDGKYHSILAQGVPIRDEAGRIQRWAGINLDISRLKNTERALLEADRRKDEFLATLAHELRNPLAPIRNAVRILDSDAADDRQRKWGREVIARQVQRMSLLLDDLLDVSRITRGQLELKKDYVDLKSVVGIAVETARPLLDAKQHQLTVNLPAGNVKLEADPLRLSQVIGNLLTNAAKYTDPEGTIALHARIENAELVISIRDNGIGLTSEVAARALHHVLAGELGHRSRRRRPRHRPRAGQGPGGAARRTRRGAQRGPGPRQRIHRPPAAQGARAVERRDPRGEHRRRECQRRAPWAHSRRRRQSRRRRVAGAGAALLGLRSVHCVQWRRGAGGRCAATVRAPPSSTSACRA